MTIMYITINLSKQHLNDAQDDNNLNNHAQYYKNASMQDKNITIYDNEMEGQPKKQNPKRTEKKQDKIRITTTKKSLTILN